MDEQTNSTSDTPATATELLSKMEVKPNFLTILVTNRWVLYSAVVICLLGNVYQLQFSKMNKMLAQKAVETAKNKDQEIKKLTNIITEKNLEIEMVSGKLAQIDNINKTPQDKVHKRKPASQKRRH